MGAKNKPLASFKDCVMEQLFVTPVLSFIRSTPFMWVLS
jgi:hypothetical protein